MKEPPPTLKRCGKCDTRKPLGDFTACSRTKDKVQTWCKSCGVEYQRQRRRAAGKKELDRLPGWKERALKSAAEKKEKWTKENKDRKQEADRRVYLAASENIRRRVREYAEANRAQISARAKSYRERNREALNAAVRARYAASPSVRASQLVRGMLKRTLKATKAEKVSSTASAIGYTGDKLKARMEVQFLPGMSWSNHGAWHIDHKISIAEFVARGETRPHIVNALCNLQPLWATDNLIKGPRPMRKKR